MPAPLPWFPFYVDDFETDEAVRGMSHEEVGVLVRLLCWQWREGSIPAEVTRVARTLNARRAVVQRVLERAFSREDDQPLNDRSRLVNHRLAQTYADALSKSEKARDAGIASGRARAARAQQTLSGRSTDGERVRSRIRSDIHKSLSFASEQGKGNGVAKTPASVPDGEVVP